MVAPLANSLNSNPISPPCEQHEREKVEEVREVEESASPGDGQYSQGDNCTGQEGKCYYDVSCCERKQGKYVSLYLDITTGWWIN